MSQLIPGGLCGIVESEPGNTQVGPYYPIVCPKCKDETDAELGVNFGKADDMAYAQEHHGELLQTVEIPMQCGVCKSRYTIHLKKAIIGLVLFVTEKKRG